MNVMAVAGAYAPRFELMNCVQMSFSSCMSYNFFSMKRSSEPPNSEEEYVESDTEGDTDTECATEKAKIDEMLCKRMALKVWL